MTLKLFQRLEEVNMAFKLNGTGANVTKMYLFPLVEAGPLREFAYVTTDTAATVAGDGYIDTTTADGQIGYDMLREGDKVRVYQIASLDDTQPISDDIATGITDYSEHIVVTKTATNINLSDDLVDFVVTGES